MGEGRSLIEQCVDTLKGHLDGRQITKITVGDERLSSLSKSGVEIG
jgi:hypothetical protein